MPMLRRIAALFAAPLALAAAAAAADPPRLQIPVDCRLGETCFLQNYVDADPAPQAAKDYACGAQTYDKHTGTDFRIPSLRPGGNPVSVLASAPGKVLRLRDGVDDVSIRQRDGKAPDGQECGNGVLIDHGGGWSTQYCHMMKGSLAVKSGDQVTAGQKLGSVGLSGMTEFPHLHITVRQGEKPVDPFAFEAPEGACGGGRSLWDPAAKAALAYRPGAVLNVGFADKPVVTDAIDSGDLPQPTAQTPALVAYARAIGLRKGDVQEIQLKNPAGAVFAEQKAQPLPRDQAQNVLFVGRKRPPEGFPAGTWTATYRVLRDGKPVVERSFSLKL